MDTRTGTATTTGTPQDYVFNGDTATVKSVSFPSGTATSVSSPGLIDILADCNQESDETIILNLVNPSNSNLVATDSTTTVTIADDDRKFYHDTEELLW